MKNNFLFVYFYFYFFTLQQWINNKLFMVNGDFIEFLLSLSLSLQQAYEIGFFVHNRIELEGKFHGSISVAGSIKCYVLLLNKYHWVRRNVRCCANGKIRLWLRRDLSFIDSFDSLFVVITLDFRFSNFVEIYRFHFWFQSLIWQLYFWQLLIMMEKTVSFCISYESLSVIWNTFLLFFAKKGGVFEFYCQYSDSQLSWESDQFILQLYYLMNGMKWNGYPLFWI